MPKIFTIKGYIVYFWSNENDEPVHVHVAKGAPRPNATKIWLTKSGGCVLAKKQDDVAQKDLNELMEIIAAQHFLICLQWKQHHRVDTIKFYC